MNTQPICIINVQNNRQLIRAYKFINMRKFLRNVAVIVEMTLLILLIGKLALKKLVSTLMPNTKMMILTLL